MVMTRARAPAQTPAKKVITPTMVVRAPSMVQPVVIEVKPGRVGDPSIEHVFKIATGAIGTEIKAKLAEAIKESKKHEMQLLGFKEAKKRKL
jgi:hypothetical protein